MDLGEFRYGDEYIKEGIFSSKRSLCRSLRRYDLRNITERRRTEEALSVSEARFQQLLDSNIIGFMQLDANGRSSMPTTPF